MGSAAICNPINQMLVSKAEAYLITPNTQCSPMHIFSSEYMIELEQNDYDYVVEALKQRKLMLRRIKDRGIE
jgi:hypothetical protein